MVRNCIFFYPDGLHYADAVGMDFISIFLVELFKINKKQIPN